MKTSLPIPKNKSQFNVYISSHKDICLHATASSWMLHLVPHLIHLPLSFPAVYVKNQQLQRCAVSSAAANALHQGQEAHCQAFQAGRGAAWYLHHALPYPYAFRLLGGWLGYFPPPGSHYLDKCGALSTEIKCCVYKSKCVVNFDLLFLKKERISFLHKPLHAVTPFTVIPNSYANRAYIFYLALQIHMMFCHAVHSHQAFQDEKLVPASKS